VTGPLCRRVASSEWDEELDPAIFCVYVRKGFPSYFSEKQTDSVAHFPIPSTAPYQSFGGPGAEHKWWSYNYIIKCKYMLSL